MFKRTNKQRFNKGICICDHAQSHPLIWELLEKNGKEMPHASFNKKTAHVILKDLKLHHARVLEFFKVNEKEREYRIWQRDALAVEMDSKKKLEQKIDYIHGNPLHEKWNLAKRPENTYGHLLNIMKRGKIDLEYYLIIQIDFKSRK